MKKKYLLIIGVIVIILLAVVLIYITYFKEGDAKANRRRTTETTQQGQTVVTPNSERTDLEDGLSTIRFEGDYGFDDFLENGGAESDQGVVDFLSNNLLQSIGFSFEPGGFGCSTISVKNAEGQQLFGRNFDWEHSNAQIVQTIPNNGYASISTVNLDFLSGYERYLNLLPKNVRAVPAIYAPMDGMNEEGLVAAVLVIQDADTIHQKTVNPDLTTTTALRLLLDKAATVDEAIALLRQYDLNSSMEMMIHFSIADKSGRSVAVEYVNNEMNIIETPILTNFYLSEGEKQGIGTNQSHTRFDILKKALDEHKTMEVNDVRDVLSSVSKGNFGEFESTEWSIVYNQQTGEVRYYHRENYNQSYVFNLK